MIKLIENYKALGTVWHIDIYDIKYNQVNIEKDIDSNNYNHESKEKILEIKNEIVEIINSFEKLYTRFDENSLLNKYNRGEIEKIKKEYNVISEYIKPYGDLMDMIKLGQKYNYDSEGVFDIYIKDKLENIGYGESKLKIEYIKDKNKEIVDKQKNIDLGGIGKGYLIDKITKYLKDKDIEYFLINGGGDIYVTSDNEEQIELYMEHPVEQGNYIYKIKLKNKAFCVSSSFKRSWEYEGKLHNHFINTKKASNLNDLVNNEMVWATAYVIGDTATMTDVYATIACIDKNISHNNIENLEYFIIKQNGDIIKSKNYPKLED